MNKTVQSDVLLLIAAAIWGTAFVSQKEAMDSMGPLLFTGIRFSVGGILLLIIQTLRYNPKAIDFAFSNSKKDLPAIKKRGRKFVWVQGVAIIGTLAFIGSCLQQIGVVYTTAGRAGFITGIYVVLVPLLGIFVGIKTRWWNWGGAILCLTGLLLMSTPHLKSGNDALIFGDILIGLCAVIFALHVLAISFFVKKIDGITIAAGQAIITGIFSLLLVPIFEPVSLIPLLESVKENIIPIAHAGLLSVGVAYTLQIIAQKNAPPAHAAILLSLEAPFAALGGVIILNEKLIPIEYVGAGIMMMAMLFSQWPLFIKKN